MKQIKQNLEYEGVVSGDLRLALKAWHEHHPLVNNGIDWQFKYLYATMTDEDCVLFLIKHPEYIGQFRTV